MCRKTREILPLLEEEKKNRKLMNQQNVQIKYLCML